MSLLLWSGNETAQDRIIDSGPTLIMWPNVDGNSATTIAPFHQVAGQEGLAGWQISSYSANGGTVLAVSGDWLYLQILIGVSVVEEDAEWSLFWMAGVADTGTSYAVGLTNVSNVAKLQLWKRVGAISGPPTYTPLAAGSTTLSKAVDQYYRLNIALSQITDSGDGDYRRIKVYIDDNLEINHQNTDCVQHPEMSLIQQEVTGGSGKVGACTMFYDHAAFNDDGGSNANTKGLLGESFAICGYQVKADVDDPNDYSVHRGGTGANATTGESGGNAWLKDTDEEWKPANEWLGATVTCNSKTFVVTGNTGTDQLDGTGGWDDAIPGDGLAWNVISSTHKKYRALDEKNEENPGPASSPRTDPENTSLNVSGGAAQGFAMVDSDHIAGSPQSVDGVHVFMDANKDYTLCSDALSEAGETLGTVHSDQWLNAPEGGAWSISIWDDLQIKFATPDDPKWVLMEVAGHRLKTAVPNDNDVAVHADETGWCPPVVSAFIPRVIIF